MKQKKVLTLLLPAFVMSFAFAFSQGEIPDEKKGSVPMYRKINPNEALRLMKEEKALVLDVRTPEEYSAVRISGSILLPDYEITQKAPLLLQEKSALILVYCRSGRRSQAAALQLIKMGYTNIFDFGGIVDWPYETVSGK